VSILGHGGSLVDKTGVGGGVLRLKPLDGIDIAGIRDHNGKLLKLLELVHFLLSLGVFVSHFVRRRFEVVVVAFDRYFSCDHLRDQATRRNLSWSVAGMNRPGRPFIVFYG
jgi:hypothetical protein